MSKLLAAFHEFEIPFGIGDLTAGWIPPERKVRFKLDAIQANLTMLKNDTTTLVMVSLDTLFVGTEDADAYRAGIADALGIDIGGVSVSATHNHCGPAMLPGYDAPKDEKLVSDIGRMLVEACSQLQQKLEPAVMGSGFTYDNSLTRNRRYITRDGSSVTMPNLSKVDVLCAEGPIDPQIGVVCVRNMDGRAMGYVVNFACHPLYYGGQCIATANFPGVLRRVLKEKENPDCVTLFLNGAAGDISHGSPFPGQALDMEAMGTRLAEHSFGVALAAQYDADVDLDFRICEVAVQRRHLDDAHIARAKRVLAGEDVVIDPRWHPVSTMPAKDFASSLIELRRQTELNPSIPVTLQAMKLGDLFLAFTPGELFTRFGMEVKVNSPARKTFVVGYSNGNIGYVFTREAQERGGYEATPCGGSVTDYTAGQVLVDGMSRLLNELT